MANPIQSCYTVSRMKTGRQAVMKDGRELLPQGWQLRIALITAAAVAGNLLVRVIPWPESSLAAYEAAMEPASLHGIRFLASTLLAAPLAEELIFRALLYGWLRGYMGFWSSSLISALAFGLYHGNWIQGIYAFTIGMILAWGYETSIYRKYLMVVLMHGAANLTSLVVFGL